MLKGERFLLYYKYKALGAWEIVKIEDDWLAPKEISQKIFHKYEKLDVVEL